jgi:hypothetical protein
MGLEWDWSYPGQETPLGMFLWRNKKRFSREHVVATAKQVADRYRWPWLEPVHIQNRLFTWTVVTGYNQIGCNIRVVISKRTGEAIRWSYVPR